MSDSIAKAGANSVVGSVASKLAELGLEAFFPGGGLAYAFLKDASLAVIEGVTPMLLSGAQLNRIDSSCKDSINIIQKRLTEGNPIRSDEFYSYDYNTAEVSEAGQLLEATLLKVRDEYEAKKQKYYAHFFANINFEPSISYTIANSVLKSYEQISYRQIQILAYLSNGTIIESGVWDGFFHRIPELANYYDIYTDIKDLYNMGLITQPSSQQGFQLGIPRLSLSPIGKIMIKLFDLNEIPNDEKKEINEKLSLIQTIIANYQK